MKKLLPILVICLILAPSFVFADTHAAADCELATVQAAVDASTAGDTVTLPTCTATWADTLSITKGITLQGNGSGNTVITGNKASGSMINYSPTDPTQTFRLTAIKLDADNKTGSNVIYIGNTSTTTYITNLRIDNSILMGGATNIFQIRGLVYGLIDNNTITGPSATCRIFSIIGATSGADNGSNAWTLNETSGVQLGTSKSLYVEDNTISGGILDESSQGSKFVFRYNTLTTAGATYLDTHGNQTNPGAYPANCDNGSYNQRGNIATEIYRNTVSAAGAVTFFDIRGGTNIVYQNAVTSTYGAGGNTIIKLRDEDNNSAAEMSDNCYPMKTAAPGYDPIQDSYLWGNTLTYSGSTNPLVTYRQDGAGDGVIVTDATNYWTDYYWPGSWSDAGTARTYWTTGTTRPGTCATGDVYVETGDIVYRCTATNTWTLQYAPYSYPHPLQGTATTYTVTPSTSTGCTVTPSAAETVNSGDTRIYTMTKAYGYEITATGCTLSGSTCTTAAVTGNLAVVCIPAKHMMEGIGTGSGSITGIGTGSGTITLGN